MKLPVGWTPLPTAEEIEANFGFIYRITNLISGRKYIGKKQFWRTENATPHLKRRRMVRGKESDWRCYTSSSKYVNFDILANGLEHFRFEILSLHATKKRLWYAEVETQVLEDVLRAKAEDGTRSYYNCAIEGVRFIPD